MFSAFLMALSSAVEVLAWIACLSPSIAWNEVCVGVGASVCVGVCVSCAGPYVNPRSDFNLIQNQNQRVGV